MLQVSTADAGPPTLTRKKHALSTIIGGRRMRNRRILKGCESDASRMTAAKQHKSPRNSSFEHNEMACKQMCTGLADSEHDTEAATLSLGSWQLGADP